MAQKSIPSSNKVGLSMYWNNMWDDKNNYKVINSKSILIKNIISILFTNNNIFFKKYCYLTNNYKFKFSNLFKNKKLFIYNNLKNHNVYISKIWLFKLNNWFIVYFSIFYFNINKKKLKKKYFKKHLNYLFKISDNF